MTPKRSSTSSSRPNSSDPPLTDHWRGCLGVRLSTDVQGFGEARGTPLLDAEVRLGQVAGGGGERIWRLTGEIPLPDGPRAYDQELVRLPGGALALRTDRSALGIDVSKRRLTVDAPTRGLVLQLVATYGLPLLLETADALVLHGCAAVPPGAESAVIVCATSGTGKSTLLLALLAAGWRAVTEDVSVVDLRGGDPRVWPGPPWLRRAGGGPAGAVALYEMPDKTAWDISAHVVATPMPVSSVVFMDAAGGEEIVYAPITHGHVLAALAASTMWLSDPTRRAERAFAASARVASRVRGARLRLPIADDWSARAEDRLRRAVEGA